MTARFIVADVFDGLASLEDGSVDLVVTSPPFLALRSYLPADHADKGKEIGSEATPAEFIDTLLRVTAELRRVLAPHGSICVELGDTYAGSGGAGGDYEETGLRGGQNHFDGSASGVRRAARKGYGIAADRLDAAIPTKGQGWPLTKSRTLIPSLYQIALAYGFNPLTGLESPAGQWRIRNVITWARPNPPVGALGDKWRPATSDLVIACTSGKRYWDDLATRKPHQQVSVDRALRGRGENAKDKTAETFVMSSAQGNGGNSEAGAPLLDYWVIPPGGYTGSHYAVFPEELVVPCVQAMCPQRVCVACGEPSRRIVKQTTHSEERAALAAHIKERRLLLRLSLADVNGWFGYAPETHNWETTGKGLSIPNAVDWGVLKERLGVSSEFDALIEGERAWTESLIEYEHVSNHPSGWTQDANGRVYQRLDARKNRVEHDAGWSDCGHDTWRPGLILDPFAGSGTTLAVATGHGYDAIGIDLDSRNADLARDRVGPFLMELV